MSKVENIQDRKIETLRAEIHKVLSNSGGNNDIILDALLGNFVDYANHCGHSKEEILEMCRDNTIAFYDACDKPQIL